MRNKRKSYKPTIIKARTEYWFWDVYWECASRHGHLLVPLDKIPGRPQQDSSARPRSSPSWNNSGGKCYRWGLKRQYDLHSHTEWQTFSPQPVGVAKSLHPCIDFKVFAAGQWTSSQVLFPESPRGCFSPHLSWLGEVPFPASVFKAMFHICVSPNECPAHARKASAELLSTPVRE